LSKTAPAAAPTAAPAASPAEAPTAAPATTTQTAAVATGGGYFVQLLSVKDQAGAQGAWSRLQGKFPSLLGSASSKIERADLGDRGTFYRLLTGPLPSEAAASKLCGDLKAKGQACLVKKP